MKRREFILGGAALAMPAVARAQEAARPVVAIVSGAAPGEVQDRGIAALRRGLAQTGFEDARNVSIEQYLADPSRMHSLVSVLVARNVSVIVTSGVAATQAVKAATNAIPVIFNVGGDPIDLGLVASLNRPGSNVTGISNLNNELEAKRLELLVELIPGTSAVAALVNATSGNYQRKLAVLEPAARALGRPLRVLSASTEAEFDHAFTTVAQEHIGALTIASDNYFGSQTGKLADLVARHRVPSIHAYRDFPRGGGLASYGPSLDDGQFKAGIYAGRILKGEKPADLPVMQPTIFEFILNLKTAKALNVTIPLPLVGRADEVIE
jgi:putative ABC transport system substrate-binding protein